MEQDIIHLRGKNTCALEIFYLFIQQNECLPPSPPEHVAPGTQPADLAGWPTGGNS